MEFYLSGEPLLIKSLAKQSLSLYSKNESWIIQQAFARSLGLSLDKNLFGKFQAALQAGQNPLSQLSPKELCTLHNKSLWQHWNQIFSLLELIDEDASALPKIYKTLHQIALLHEKRNETALAIILYQSLYDLTKDAFYQNKVQTLQNPQLLSPVDKIKIESKSFIACSSKSNV